MTVSEVRLTAGTFAVGSLTPDGLTPEGLMIYLQTRLDGLDGQINSIFEKQQKTERVRKELANIQTEIERLKTDQNPQQLLEDPTFQETINNAINAIEKDDPVLAAQLRDELNKEGQILFVQDGKYFSSEVDASKTYINSLMKQLESSAQLEMISLQSIMSSRQTAVQLSTNLVSALGEGPRAIAANIGK